MTIMTQINYINGGGIHARPSTAFAADGTVLTATSTEFAIDNPDKGVTHHYSIDLLGTGFTYSGGHPNGGTITEVKIKDAHGNVYVDFTNLLGDVSLADFWTFLKHGSPKAALDNLVGSPASATGSNDGDQVETYGDNSVYQLGPGNDILDISNNFTRASGGAGNDTFRIDQGGLFGLDLHGGQFDGTVAPAR